MKENWERLGNPVLLDLPEASRLVSPVFGGKRVAAVERLGEGYSNSNYKLTIDGGAVRHCVLRVYRGDAAVADKELAIARLVKESVPVPEILFADTSCSALEKPWALLEWKEGYLLRDAMRSGASGQIAQAAASAGQVLAGIHAFTFAEAGFFGEDLKIRHSFQMDAASFLEFIEQSLFVQGAGRLLGEELTGALWAFCRRHAPLLSDAEEEPVLVHSDYNGLNVLVRENSGSVAVSAVLDWEFAFSGSRLADIGNMLRYEANDSLFEKHFINAYQAAGGVVGRSWKLRSKLEDLVALCDLLNRSSELTPNRNQDLKRLIAGTVLQE